MKKINDHWKIILLIFLMSASGFVFAESKYYDEGLQLIINDQKINSSTKLVLKDDRVLVPLRLISEYLGADVKWQEDLRRVDITKDKKEIRVWIDSHLIAYGDGSYGISDVAPLIIDDLTYVPVRLIANALGVDVNWENDTRSVIINSKKETTKTAFYDVTITSPNQNASIKGETIVKIDASEEILKQAQSVKLIMVDKKSAKGYVVSESKTDLTTLTYLPKKSDAGEFVWVVAYYDGDRNWLGGTSIPVVLKVEPQVSISVDARQSTEALSLKTNFNFMPYKVAYELENVNTKEIKTVSVADPFNSYTWSIGGLKTGSYIVRSIVYDHEQNTYKSQDQNVQVKVEPYLNLSGVSHNQVIDGGVYLIASRNFDVKETIFTIEDVKTGEARVLTNIPWGGYTWYPTSEDIGEKYLRVKVIDTNDKLYVSSAIKIKVDFSPKISLLGVGPNQIVTDDVSLSVRANVDIEQIKYYIEHVSSGKQTVLTEAKSIFKPTTAYEGQVKIYAKALDKAGKELKTETIELKVYLGNLYGPKAIIEKDKFLPFVSVLARSSFESTGMSAALQAAQGILETGWGQSVPVDKYSNQLSYNLFGIKGSGTNGSVISNTWEVYNGVSFRTDANFRAYYNVEESWADHKKILLEKSRYQIFRDVMYDPTLGAWAVRRAGYATDPNYPIKLMNLIKQYNLHLLDEVGVY